MKLITKANMIDIPHTTASFLKPFFLVSFGSNVEHSKWKKMIKSRHTLNTGTVNCANHRFVSSADLDVGDDDSLIMKSTKINRFMA